MGNLLSLYKRYTVWGLTPRKRAAPRTVRGSSVETRTSLRLLSVCSTGWARGSGHGGNALLKNRDARNFRFTILQRVSPDEDPWEVNRLEGTWKKRLHTRTPDGLNEN
jgi:hypothetical protein